MNAKKDWWTDFFDSAFAEFFLERDEKTLEDTVSFLTETLSLESGMTLFDQCCGLGNIDLALAKRGIKTVGIDKNEAYIDTAKKQAAKENLASEFSMGDAFVFVPSVKCDAAINWYTSFGYNLDDQVNKEMLKRAYESLKEGGYFALDFHNIPFVLRQPEVNKQTKKSLEGHTCEITRVSKINLENGTLFSEWTYAHPDGTTTSKQGETRIYLPHQLKEMLTEVGFKTVRFYGGVDKSQLGIDSSRCIAVAQK
jgi:SAM-dependent methyltransferase